MPFRICNAPATFQRAINIIFDKIKNVVIDMDDILIFTETKEKHYEVLEKTLGLLKENGVSVNFEKSNFSQEEIKFLGHKINKDGIKPVISKLESCSTTRISIKKHSQKPHGFINRFRPFIPNLSIITADLYDKLKEKGYKIKLTTEDANKIKKS
ncbi:Transposon Ty3-I Gag-Pol polyprotein [Dictyocoela roeselum]|nr:Transposon Ty3-I Gag-Pol polyprotein [Dictyocoela roeselum]